MGLDDRSSSSTARNVSASRSSLITGIAFLGVSILSYAFVNVMAWLLPIADYGVLGLAQSYILIAATLLNSGFPWGLARILARQHSLQEGYRAAKSAFIGNLLLATCICTIIIIGNLFAGLRFGSNTAPMLALVLLEVALLAITAFWAGVLQGTLRFGALSFNRFIEALLKLVMSILLVSIGWGALGAVAAIIFGTIVSLLLLAWNTRQFTFWHERSWGEWGTYKDSLTIFVGLCALTIIGNIDIIGVKFFSDPQRADILTGYYQAAAVLPRIPILLANAYATALFPYMARADESHVANTVAIAMKYAILLIIPIDLILLALPHAIIIFVFPASYIASGPSLQIVALGSALLSITTIIVASFQARGRASIPALVLPLGVVIEVVMLRLLVPIYTIEGAAIAFCTASAFACGALLFAALRYYAWPIRISELVKYFSVGAGLVGMLILLPHMTQVWTVISIGVALIIYVILLSIVGLIRPADFMLLTAGIPIEHSSIAAVRMHCLRIIERLNQVGLVAERLR